MSNEIGKNVYNCVMKSKFAFLKALLVPLSFFVWINIYNNLVLHFAFTENNNVFTPKDTTLLAKFGGETLYLAVFVLLIYFWAKRYRLSKEDLGLNKIKLKTFLFWCLILTLAMILFSGLHVWLALAFHTMSLRPHWPTLYNIYQSIAAGILEELAFRGVIQSVLMKNTTVRWAIFIQALFFAITHNLIRGTIFDMVEIFIVGLIFGIVRHRIKNITPGIAGHAIADIIASAL